MEREILKNNFMKNNFDITFHSDTSEVNELFLDEITKDESVYIGGSMTIENMKTFDILNENMYNLNWHWKDQDLVRNKEKYPKSVYITSSNAVTLDGKLVNIDGRGNRVSAMFYDYDRVFVVVGKNKIVKDYDQAIERIRNIAAPMNAKRLGLKTPCVKAGRCMDCSSYDRICNVEVVIHKCPQTTKIHICVVDEDLGY